MKTYKAKQDIINGVLLNTNGQPNILFRKGDAIVGQQVEKFIFNQNMKGIIAKPTVPSARVETPDGLTFVPFSQIDIIADNSPQGSNTNTGNDVPKNTVNSTATTKYITTKSANVWKSNPKATGDFNQSLAVRTLSQGTVIDVISEGTTMTSSSSTPTLNIGNGEWVNKSDAKLYSGDVKVKASTSFFTPKNIIIGVVGICVVLGLLKVTKII